MPTFYAHFNMSGMSDSLRKPSEADIHKIQVNHELKAQHFVGVLNSTGDKFSAETLLYLTRTPMRRENKRRGR